jgi:hypothetical protein
MIEQKYKENLDREMALTSDVDPFACFKQNGQADAIILATPAKSSHLQAILPIPGVGVQKKAPNARNLGLGGPSPPRVKASQTWNIFKQFHTLLKTTMSLDLETIFETISDQRDVKSMVDREVLNRGILTQRLYAGLQPYRSVLAQKAMVGSQRFLSGVAKSQLPLALLLIAIFISPANALEDIGLQSLSATNAMVPDPGPEATIGLYATALLVVAGLVTTTKNYSPQLMGVSSFVWFIMRNDATTIPIVSWA